jgi:hypothetical protein
MENERLEHQRRLESVYSDIFSRYPVMPTSSYIFDQLGKKIVSSASWKRRNPKGSPARVELDNNLAIYKAVNQFVHRHALKGVPQNRNERTILQRIMRGNRLHPTTILGGMRMNPERALDESRKLGVSPERLAELLRLSAERIDYWKGLAKQSDALMIDHVMRKPLEYFGALAGVALNEIEDKLKSGR